MIRFYYRKMIKYNLQNESPESLREKIIAYYAEENTREDAWIFLENGGVIGWTQYECLAKEEYIQSKMMLAEETLWENAGKYFANNPESELLVIDKKNSPLTFCYSDEGFSKDVWSYLVELERLNRELPVDLLEFYPGIQQVCIYGCNELAWRLYNILGQEKCQVLGAEWNWFEIKEVSYGETYARKDMLHVYAEGIALNKEKYSSLEAEFRFITDWYSNVVKKIMQEELLNLQRCGGNICIVKVPLWNTINYSKCTKNDLINLFSPLLNFILADDKDIKERQKDFFGEKVFKYLEQGVQKDNITGWFSTGLFYDVFCKKTIEESKEKRIYLLGPCIAMGVNVVAEDSLTACLQRLVYPNGYEVVSVFASRPRIGKTREIIKRLPLKEKDIVLYIETEQFVAENGDLSCVDLHKIFNSHREKTWIRDPELIHTNYAANQAIAEEIYKVYLKDVCEKLEKNDRNIYIQRGEILSKTAQTQIDDFVKTICVYPEDMQKNKKIGAIVMNCNPFTIGHKFLIETASKMVDFLYIFVVKEEMSFFTYEVRYALVEKGIAHLKNVAVVSSGNYVLSYTTLPVYFEKAQKQEARIDASGDIEIFARYVAPKLGINYRIVGEEPTDLVTRQYNEQMSKLLPDYGIECVEIPRFSYSEDQVISASKVRRYFLEENWEMVKLLVPESTFEMLKKLKSKSFIIYGAGKAGQRMNAFLRRVNANIAGWLDKNYLNIDLPWEVEAPEELLNKSYDFIIIAVEKEELFMEIKEKILAMDKGAEHNIMGLDLQLR